MVTAVSSQRSQNRPRHMVGVWETLETYVREGHRLAGSVQNGLLPTFPTLSSPLLKDRGIGIPVDGAVGIKGQGVLPHSQVDCWARCITFARRWGSGKDGGNQ